MSSQAKRMAKDVEYAKSMLTQNVETQNMEFRISVTMLSDKYISPYEADCYMLVTGIPKGLPAEMFESVEKTVRVKFVQTMSSHAFVETYNRGHNRQDSSPLYVNTDVIQSFTIDSVSKA